MQSAATGDTCADVDHTGSVDVIDVVHVVNVAFRSGDSNLVCPDRLDSAAVVTTWFGAALAAITDSNPGELAVEPLLDDLAMRIISGDPSAADAILDFGDALDALVANNSLPLHEALPLEDAALAFWPVVRGYSELTADALLASAHAINSSRLTLNRCVDREPNGEDPCADEFVVSVSQWIDPEGSSIALSCRDQCDLNQKGCRAAAMLQPPGVLREYELTGCSLKLLICIARCSLSSPH